MTLPTTVTFAPNNRLVYAQDFQFWRGIPAGVTFTVEDRDAWCRLTAPGYGGEPYGNGALLVETAVVVVAGIGGGGTDYCA